MMQPGHQSSQDTGCNRNFASLFKIMNKMVTPAADSLLSVSRQASKTQLQDGKHHLESPCSLTG